MTVYSEILPLFTDVLTLDGFVQDPVLIFGIHEYVHRPKTLNVFRYYRLKHYLKLKLSTIKNSQKSGGIFIRDYMKESEISSEKLESFKTFEEILHEYGFNDVKTIDFFDQRADYLHDMNKPIDSTMKGQFSVIIENGSIEHVFDTKQCLWNLFDMLKVGGHLLLTVPCKGFFDHGLHTFSPECLIQACQVNGLDVRLVKYSSTDGLEVENPDLPDNTLVWIAAKKVNEIEEFTIPQQGRWEKNYAHLSR